MEDLRVKKTLLSLEKAFYELRKVKPLEQIKIKTLCENAMVNKTTFYNYFSDIYVFLTILKTKSLKKNSKFFHFVVVLF